MTRPAVHRVGSLDERRRVRPCPDGILPVVREPAVRLPLILVTASLGFVVLANAILPSVAFGKDGVAAIGDAAAAAHLEQYCVRCHDAAKAEANVRLDLPPAQVPEAAWGKIADVLHDAAMPPEDEPQPAAELRAHLAGAVQPSTSGSGAITPPSGTLTLSGASSFPRIARSMALPQRSSG